MAFGGTAYGTSSYGDGFLTVVVEPEPPAEPAETVVTMRRVQPSGLSELRLGPLNSQRDMQTAVQELESKLNSVFRQLLGEGGV